MAFLWALRSLLSSRFDVPRSNTIFGMHSHSVPWFRQAQARHSVLVLRDEKDRLRKGLERFANCGDSEKDYQALGCAFPDFWPLRITVPSSEAPSISRKRSPRTLAEMHGITREHYDTD